MKLVKSTEQMKALSSSTRESGQRIVLVPTMGYLHRGHMELLKRGKEQGGLLVLSIFVNPTQFSPNEDFEAYPRDTERDLSMAESAGVDVVFMPTARDMYPQGFQTFVRVEELEKRLCGRTRPGHFRGVATVVLKLFNIVRPHKAVFGLKDYQQFLIIKRLVRDLDLDVELIGVETVRDEDGVAVSSRNEYLSEEERRAARVIPKALSEAKRAFSAGERRSTEIIGKMKKIMEKEPRAVIEYIDICDPETLEDLEVIRGSALVALAVRIGRARLIDNCLLH